MEYGLMTYFDFAENDYQFFRNAYDSGIKGGPLASLGQNICEKYLKHIISEYAQPETRMEEVEKENILRTHSLRKLMGYCTKRMGLEITEDMEDALSLIDGFYFSTRYPGDESFFPSARDIEKANDAVDYARAYAIDVCYELGSEKEEESEEDFEENQEEPDSEEETFDL